MAIGIIRHQHTQPPPADARIVRAAVRVDGVVYTSWRHDEALQYLATAGPRLPEEPDAQGFVDQHGNYYNRYQSARIAYRARQVPLRIGRSSGLISEDVWEDDGTPRRYPDAVGKCRP